MKLSRQNTPKTNIDVINSRNETSFYVYKIKLFEDLCVLNNAKYDTKILCTLGKERQVANIRRIIRRENQDLIPPRIIVYSTNSRCVSNP